jgi:flagellar biosynthesis protein FlhF
VLHKKHKSIAYITNGQIVAKNIQKANPVDFLIRLENFNIDRQHIEDKFGGN